jgi:hypothetical protein
MYFDCISISFYPVHSGQISYSECKLIFKNNCGFKKKVGFLLFTNMTK